MNYADVRWNTVVDYDQILDQCGNDADLARQSVRAFAAEVTGHVDELQTAFEQQAVDSVIAIANTVKTSAEMTGAHLVFDAAHEIESAAHAGDFSGAMAALPELQTQFIRLQEWLSDTAVVR